MPLINFSVIEPRISVIISYHNLGKYIQDCINSVLNQDYKNYEIIIVNDNSDEKNYKILRKIATRNTAIIDFDEHIGQLGCFIAGLGASSGDFICFLNADDILLPSCFKILVQAHLNNNIVCAYSKGSKISEKDEYSMLNPANKQMFKLADRIFYKQIQNLYNNDIDISLKIRSCGFKPFNKNKIEVPRCILAKKSVLDILNFYPDIEFWRDDALNIIFSMLNYIGKSAFVSCFCYLYRDYSIDNKKNIEFNLKNEKFYFDMAKMLIKSKKQLISKYGKKVYLKMIFRTFLNLNIKTCAKIIKTFAHEFKFKF